MTPYACLTPLLAIIAATACSDSDDTPGGAGGSGGTSSSSGGTGGSGGTSSSSGGTSGTGGSGGTGMGGPVTASCLAGDVCIEAMISESGMENFEDVCFDQQTGTVGSGCPTAGVSGVCTYLDAAFGTMADMIFYNLDAMGVEDSETFCGVLMGTWSTS